MMKSVPFIILVHVFFYFSTFIRGEGGEVEKVHIKAFMRTQNDENRPFDHLGPCIFLLFYFSTRGGGGLEKYILRPS